MPSSADRPILGHCRLEIRTRHIEEVVTGDEEISVVDVATRIGEGTNLKTDRSPSMQYRVVNLGFSWKQSLEGDSFTIQRRMKASGNSLQKS